MVYLDTGLGDEPKKGKKSKKGFKSDRFANFQMKKNRENNSNFKVKGGTPSQQKPTAVKSITFDDAERRKYLLSLHKNKNERRVRAFVDAKRKIKKENNRFRREQREEARLAYNRFAKVPILPDYSFRLPQEAGESSGDDDEDEESAWNEEMDEEDVDDGEQLALKRHRKQLRAREKELLATSVFATQVDHLDAPKSATGDTVVVEVQPLFGSARGGVTRGGPTTDGKRGGSREEALLHGDVSDLPKEVVAELLRVKEATKGPSRTPSRLNMLKELEKIRKIRKHSRKGHGKKTAKGKRKNRH